MNTTLASLPIDTNTLIVIVVAIVSGISSWLEKKRKDAAAAEKARNQNKSPQSAPREAAPAQPNLEEILRQLLGGEQPPTASPPPLGRPKEETAETVHDEPLVISREKERETAWMEEMLAPAPQVPRQPEQPLLTVHTAKPPVAIPTLTHPAKSTVLSEQGELVVPRATKISGAPRRRCSTEAQQAVAQLRSPRAARSAFVASLVFGPPKSLENSNP